MSSSDSRERKSHDSEAGVGLDGRPLGRTGDTVPASDAAIGSSTAVESGRCLMHACPKCSTSALPVPPLVRLDDHKPLPSVGLVCTCSKAVASIEGVARRCECGRIWLVTASLIGGPNV